MAMPEPLADMTDLAVWTLLLELNADLEDEGVATPDKRWDICTAGVTEALTEVLVHVHR